jgi:transposase
MGHIQGANRHEAIEFPHRLDDDSAADNPVRFIEACVDELDLEALGCRQVVAAATGRPSDQPGDLLKLYIDGARYRVRSSRRLAQEMQRHVERIWLLNKLRPEHNTSANVRRDHLNPRREVCRTFPLLCQQCELFGGELVAIAGSKFRAVNAKGRHFTNATLAPLGAQMDARVEGYLTELEAADDHDEAGTPGGARAADLQTKLAARRERRLRSKDRPAELAGSGQDQLSRTAPDSRAMTGGAGGSTVVC